MVHSGPDICGPGTKKVHVIFNYKGKNLLIKKEIRCKDDEFTHLYTLIVRPDNTYEVKIDNEKAESGSLEDDWDFLPPKTIPDPEAKKPEDWDDRAKIDDPDDKKPEVYKMIHINNVLPFLSRIGINLNISRILMPKNLKTGMMILMENGNLL